jgi:hypothetical protein
MDDALGFDGATVNPGPKGCQVERKSITIQQSRTN